jgi:osmotically inducible lipoprotein OsmB
LKFYRQINFCRYFFADKFLSAIFRKRDAMKTRNRLTATVLAATLIVGLSGCTTMSNRDKNTAIGAGVGAVAGAVLTHGSALGTVGGAAIGGVIGNQIGR